VWFARPGLKPGEGRVAVVKGGIQARHAQARGWQWLPFDNHEAIFGALAAGQAQATLLPMANAVALQQDPRLSAQGLASTVVQDPELAGDAALGVNPRDRALLDKLNDAIDEIKRDGRFDRINTRFIPLRLQ
jgi:ABC-type amino acid transport substrate-binding protein